MQLLVFIKILKVRRDGRGFGKVFICALLKYLSYFEKCEKVLIFLFVKTLIKWVGFDFGGLILSLGALQE